MNSTEAKPDANEGARRNQHERAVWLAQYFDDQFFERTKSHKGASHWIGYCRRWLFEGHGEQALREHIKAKVNELPAGRLPNKSHRYRDPLPRAGAVSAE